MKRFWILFLALVIAAAGILVAAGFSDYETAIVSSENNAAVEEAIIGVDNALVSVGSFTSENGKTDTLTKEEIDGLIASYNEKIDTYFTSDYAARGNYKEMNRYYLEEAFSQTAYCLVSGGVTDCKLTSISYSDDANTAEAEGYLLSYANEVESEEDGTFSVKCVANLLRFNAALEKVDGLWKVGKYDFDYIDDWVPGDNINVDSDQASTVNIADTVYSSFQEAYRAASEISVEEECTIHLEDVVDTDAETIVTVK